MSSKSSLPQSLTSVQLGLTGNSRHLRELAVVTGDGLGAKIQRHLLEQPDTEWRAEGLVENENAHVVWNDINPACRKILSQ